MAEPFLSEIRIMSFGFAPRGWAMCNGQLLPINQNQALFALLGTNFGGNGQTTFGLPDLRDRVPVHEGNGLSLASKGGEQAHTLTANEMPVHTHVAQASKDSSNTVATAGGNFHGPAGNQFASFGTTTPLVATTVTSVGGSQPHQNMQPFLTLNFVIALQGIFPSVN
jgi:microcystin-dependent protein